MPCSVVLGMGWRVWKKLCWQIGSPGASCPDQGEIERQGTRSRELSLVRTVHTLEPGSGGKTGTHLVQGPRVEMFGRSPPAEPAKHWRPPAGLLQGGRSGAVTSCHAPRPGSRTAEWRPMEALSSDLPGAVLRASQVLRR